MRIVATALALITVMTIGCARHPREVVAPPDREELYVVLPDREGKVGAVTVSHAGEERLLDSAYAAGRIKQEGRLETEVVTDQEVRQIFGSTLAAQPPRPASFTLFFLLGKDEFTPESEQVLQQVLAEIARRPEPEVVVIGHTDSLGSVQYNDVLSLQRAERVRRELVQRGIPADRIEVTGRGDREPLVSTKEGVNEPRNRRVEISVR